VQERLRALAQRPAEMGGEQAAPFPLTPDPFIAVQQLGQVEAKRLRDDSMWGLLWACVLIAIYVALRFFRSLRFGLAAVVPLFHDALVAIGVMAVCMKLVPETTGLNFDINLPAVAAILTVIGYSVNDTIIVFDRIRENLRVKKREAFADVINGSVNETLSRTVLTSGTTLVAAVALYVLTATTGSGIANFAFPMIAGVIVGTYSSVFVAAWLLKVLYRDERPELAA
jgi:preprotein translocase subunit SecF